MTFPTEQQTYNRLRWDTRFDVERCDVVITLRPTGTRRMPLLDLDTNVVPWHRIIEFWVDDELAWSRPQRIDRLDQIARRETDGPLTPAVLDDDQVGRPLAPHRFDPITQQWVPAPASPPAERTGRPVALRVAFWNLLFDRYDADRLRSEERWADAFGRLAALDADVIGLAEVTQSMWQLVLAEPWVRARYSTCHPPDTRALDPYGQVLLSRHPIVSARVLTLARARQAVIARVNAGLDLGVAIVHLTSNYTDGARDLRREQLAAVVERIRAAPRDAWILAGDFNAPPSEHAPLVAAAELADTWDVNPDDPGLTFDVDRNQLAATASITGRSYRYDRVLVRGLAATAARLVGIEPGPSGLPPSDHYAVCAELARDVVGVERAPGSRSTALALIPPREVWGAIQQIRCRADRNFNRWPPHVTLLFPFVDPSWLDRAARALDDAVRDLAPFTLALDAVSPIDRRGRRAQSKTVVAFPTAETATFARALHAALAVRFASLVEDRDYKPHLTVARDTPDYPDRLPIEWLVDRVAILERHDDRFEIVHEAPLAGVTITSPITSPITSLITSPITSLIRPASAPSTAEHIARRAGELIGARVELFGSAVYAPAHARDVDLLVHGAVDAERLGLREAGAPWRFRGTIDDTPVDIVVAGEDPRWLAGPADAAALVRHLDDHGRRAAFAAAWPAVRAFVDARALAGNGLGWLPTLGWAMLLAVPLCHDAALCRLAGDAIAPAWFRWLATLAAGDRIGFRDAETEAAPLWITAPAPPSRNVARTLTEGTAAHLRAEFARAAAAPARAAIALASDPPPGAMIEITGTGDPGAYVGRFRSLLDELDARPWAVTGDATGWHHILGVPDAAALPAVEAWLARSFGHPPVARLARPR